MTVCTLSRMLTMLIPVLCARSGPRSWSCPIGLGHRNLCLQQFESVREPDPSDWHSEWYLAHQQLAVGGSRDLDFPSFSDAETISATETLTRDICFALKNEDINSICAVV